MVVLTEHHLRIGDRTVLLLEGPAGWGEVSPFDGYPCDPEAARRAAEEAAVEGWPAAVRSQVAVNALVRDRAFDRDALVGYETVKVKMRVPDDVRLVEEVRDVVGPSVRLRVDANGAWDLGTAVAVIERVARLGIELVPDSGSRDC